MIGSYLDRDTCERTVFRRNSNGDNFVAVWRVGCRIVPEMFSLMFRFVYRLHIFSGKRMLSVFAAVLVLVIVVVLAPC